MKFRVTMKDHDTLHDAIREAVERDVRATGLDPDGVGMVTDARVEKVGALAQKWFRYGEYLTVEIDTEAGTCVVIPGDLAYAAACGWVAPRERP